MIHKSGVILLTIRVDLVIIKIITNRKKLMAWIVYQQSIPGRG